MAACAVRGWRCVACCAATRGTAAVTIRFLPPPKLIQAIHPDMDNQRLFLFFALAMVLMLIWQAWEQHNAPPPAPAPATTTGTPAPATSTSPSVPPAPVPSAAEATTPTPKPVEALVSGTRIQVRTDVIDAVIDSQGGDGRELKLRQHPVSLDKPEEAFPLMRDAGPELSIAQSGLIGLDGQYPNHKTPFTAEASRYTLADGQNELRIPLSLRPAGGVAYNQTY